MKWEKLGLIFSPNHENSSLISHAAVPIAKHLSDNVFKIFFSSRDVNNKSYTNYVVIDLSAPAEIIEISQEPVLSPGNLGCFDDSGAMATWLTTVDDKDFLYYIGWNLGVTVPFRNSIGLAISSSTTTANVSPFDRISEGPIIDRTTSEPHFCASCCVIKDDLFWRMWYLSCTEWKIVDGTPKHYYHIKYAESDDGINWKRKGRVAINFANKNEFAISRPSVIKDGGGWHMWYSYRGDQYRIGYAHSDDGINWTRLDDRSGIDVSENGWDSEMIEYPFVFDHQGNRYMLYNGNDYGRTGFGLAVLKND